MKSVYGRIFLTVSIASLLMLSLGTAVSFLMVSERIERLAGQDAAHVAAAAAAAIGEATAATAAAIGEATPTTTTAIKAPGCTLYAFRSRGRTVAVEAPSGAASTTAAARALLRLVDAEGAAIELLPVHRRNRRFGIGVVRHFHEGEPSGTTGFPIRHDEDAGDLPPVCTE